jgi:hypothetical protein
MDRSARKSNVSEGEKLSMSKVQLATAVGSFTLCLLLVAAAGCRDGGDIQVGGAPKFDTTYQAVLLDTGLVYYGKITGMDTDYPVLHDVYYVQQTKDATSNQVNNVLVRRGNEWHGPAMTVLNSKHIVLVEPVSANSKVAQLIAEDQKTGGR